MSHVRKTLPYKRTIERPTNECHPLVFISSKASHLQFWNRSSLDNGESDTTIFLKFCLEPIPWQKMRGGSDTISLDMMMEYELDWLGRVQQFPWSPKLCQVFILLSIIMLMDPLFSQKYVQFRRTIEKNFISNGIWFVKSWLGLHGTKSNEWQKLGVLWVWLVLKINMCIIIIWYQWPSWHWLKRDRVWWHIDDNDRED